MLPDNKEIQALIGLIEDPDPQIFEMVKQKFEDWGISAVLPLEKAWENTPDETCQNKIISIIQSIQLSDACKNLRKWARSEKKDLLYGAFWVAKYQYPDLTFEELKGKLDVMRQDIWLELNDNLTALEKVRILNHIFYDIHGFSANMKNPASPQNSFINSVLETKKGNSVSLALLYAGLARQLDIPVFGINLPHNFILAYIDPESARLAYNGTETSGVLFYINPIRKGLVFGRKEIEKFLDQTGLEHQDYYFNECTNIEFIERLIDNLIESYEKLGFLDKLPELAKLKDALN